MAFSWMFSCSTSKGEHKFYELAEEYEGQRFAAWPLEATTAAQSLDAVTVPRIQRWPDAVRELTATTMNPRIRVKCVLVKRRCGHWKAKFMSRRRLKLNHVFPDSRPLQNRQLSDRV